MDVAVAGAGAGVGAGVGAGKEGNKKRASSSSQDLGLESGSKKHCTRFWGLIYRAFGGGGRGVVRSGVGGGRGGGWHISADFFFRDAYPSVHLPSPVHLFNSQSF